MTHGSSPVIEPSPSVPLPTASSLTQRINSTTRRAHTELNAAILSLLPLALPPYTSNPGLYLRGMRCIHAIYTSFESISPQCYNPPHANNIPQNPGLTSALRRLHIPSLERRKRLSNDLHILSTSLNRAKCTEITHEEILQQHPRLDALVSHIYTEIPEHPHLLLAYYHLFYLALFNGGRYMRTRLRSAGRRFWCPCHIDTTIATDTERGGRKEIGRTLTSSAEIEEGLSFWYFDGAVDGEDLKATFKARFEETEGMLTEEERAGIVAETGYVMHELLKVVQEMGGVIGRGNAPSEGMSSLVEWRQHAKLFMQKELGVEKEDRDVSWCWLLLKHVLSMGMAELVLTAVWWVMAAWTLDVRSGRRC